MFSKAFYHLAIITDGIENLYVDYQDIESDISSLSMRVVLASAVLLFVFMGIAVLTNRKTERLKLPLFIMMSFVMAGSALLLAFSTIYLNVQSDSGGPVRWRADIEFWICGNEVELIDPAGISNKIGGWTLYERDDRSIHLEGVVIDSNTDASIGKFMNVIGGAITDDALVIPVNLAGSVLEDDFDGDNPSGVDVGTLDRLVVESHGSRFVRAIDGQTCDGQAAEVQVFVYSFNKENSTYEQTRISNPQHYTISPESDVPPGDCIIVEFAPTKEKTDKLCEQYGVRDEVRCVEFGVDPEKIGSCDIRQVNYTSIGTGADPNADILEEDHYTDDHPDDGHAHEGDEQ